MAIITNSPYEVTTATVLTTKPIYVRQIVWQEPSAAAEDLTILDKNGRTIWDENALAGGAGVSIEQDINQWCDGLNVSVIDSGTAWIYHGKEG